jgi:hypothetical protein
MFSEALPRLADKDEQLAFLHRDDGNSLALCLGGENGLKLALRHEERGGEFLFVTPRRFE